MIELELSPQAEHILRREAVASGLSVSMLVRDVLESYLLSADADAEIVGARLVSVSLSPEGGLEKEKAP